MSFGASPVCGEKLLDKIFKIFYCVCPLAGIARNEEPGRLLMRI
jgi:hypothetical protein